MDTYGQRKTAHVFGSVSLDNAELSYRFADVFNGATFGEYLHQVVRRYHPRKVFMVIDNAPYHWLDDDGKQWLKENKDQIELHRLPPYSPELMPMEGVWKFVRKETTHNRFYETTLERDTALRQTFHRCQRSPSLIAPQVARYQ